MLSTANLCPATIYSAYSTTKTNLMHILRKGTTKFANLQIKSKWNLNYFILKQTFYAISCKYNFFFSTFVA